MAETNHAESSPSMSAAVVAAAEVAVKDKDTDSCTDSSSQLLDRFYLYQNNQTGHVAPTARLTTRQLCRILCPPGNDNGDSLSQRTVTPETQLLAIVEPSSNNSSNMPYSSEGWKQAKMVPILQQATALWYYEEDCSSSSADTKSTVKGPVSCRNLADLYFAANVDDDASSSTTRLTKSTRVYSETASPTWCAIQDVPYLQLALHAFQSPSATTPSSSGAAGAVVAGRELEHTEDAVAIVEEAYFEPEPAASISTTSATNEMKDDEKQIKDELEAFLSSTDHLGKRSVDSAADAAANIGEEGDEEEDDDEAYESDNGTRYIKDDRTGNWVHEALVMQQRQAAAAAAQSSNNKSKNSNNSNSNNNRSNATKSLSSLTTTTTTTANEPNNNNIHNDNNNNNNNNNATKKRKKPSKKAQFAARNAKNWIYVTGLPSTSTEEQVQDFFSQAGIIELDPETLRPKIKLYRYKDSDVNDNTMVVAGQCKGDASICFARSESVDLAITLLNEAPFQPPSFPTTDNSSNSQQPPLTSVVRVQRAKFEKHEDISTNHGGEQGDDDDNHSKRKTKAVSNAKRKVAKLAAIQARDWDDGEFNGRLTGGRKGLRIIVLKHVFSSSHDDAGLARLEKDLLAKCQPFGTVEKITFFASNPDGVVIVKFTQPGAASEAIKALDGKVWGQENAATGSSSSSSPNDVVQANFWDGVTDYTVRNEAKEEEEMEQRHDQFGQWLDNQELPEELRLKTE